MTPPTLSATRDQYYATANIYDASGNRAWKLGGEINWMWNNGQGYQAYGDLNLRTWYQSDLVTITDHAMTKHYFIAGQRIASKLVESLAPEVAQNLKDKPVTPLSGDLAELGTIMTDRLSRDFDCVGLDYNAFYPGEPRIEALEVLQSAPETNEYHVFFYHSDHLGSSSFITDINGDATQHLQYLPFGEDFVHQQNTAAYYTPYTFSGKERDVETSLSYFGARYYEAGLSVWLSVDALADKYPGITPYNYVFNNPINGFDIDGNEGILKHNGGNSYTISMKYIAVTSGQGALNPDQIKTVQSQLNYRYGGSFPVKIGGVSIKVDFNITVEDGGDFNSANSKVQNEYGANLLQLKSATEIQEIRKKGGAEKEAKVGGVSTRIDENGNLSPGAPNATFIDESIASSNVKSVFKKTIVDEAGHLMGTSHRTEINGQSRKLGSLEKGLNFINPQDVANMIQSRILRTPSYVED